MKDVLLITGGTGSFGHAMLDYVLEHDHYDEIRIFSRDEKKQYEMRQEYPDTRIRFYIGDVRDSDSIHRAMIGVTHLFHAAAMKQVPVCEDNPLEAIQTNVIGTKNVLEAALHSNVESVVVLSTDKAVEPVNTMGITKALVERTALFYAKQAGLWGAPTKICITRYGNVIGSRGSVLPLFYRVAKLGHPLPVTDPSMTRFMMGLSEATALVQYALHQGEPGRIYIKKAPGATVGAMGNAVLSFVNRLPCEFVTRGVRPGEKLHETLVSAEEMGRARDLGEYIKVYPVGSYRASGVPKAYTSDNTNRLDVQGVVDLLNIHQEWKGEHELD